MENERLKIGIYGLGLIGGSILKSLSHQDKYDLIAVSKSSYKKAEEFAKISSDDISVLSNADIIFVCSKMCDCKPVLKQLEGVVSSDTIVVDVCSIKEFVEDDYKFNFIPSHPMAGTEFFGFDASFKELFVGAKWVIGKNNEILENLIKSMGAKPLMINSKDHDKAAAEISHLPMLISFALFDSIDEESKKIAASGFRDTTRLAMTNSDMAYDMLNLNKENILLAYEKFINSFEKIKNMNEEEFKTFAKNIAQERSKMYDKNGVNNY